MARKTQQEAVSSSQTDTYNQCYSSQSPNRLTLCSYQQIDCKELREARCQNKQQNTEEKQRWGTDSTQFQNLHINDMVQGSRVWLKRTGKPVTEQSSGPEDSHLSVINSSSTKKHAEYFQHRCWDNWTAACIKRIYFKMVKIWSQYKLIEMDNEKGNMYRSRVVFNFI